MILRNLTRDNISVENAWYIITDLGERVAKVGSPFALTKDDIKVCLQGITEVKRSQPSAFVEDVLSFIYKKFSLHEALVLQQKFQVSISDFSMHLKNGDRISSRLFHFNNASLVYQNYRNYFKALWLFEGKREELQDRISRSVSEHFNLKPLSLPMIVGATVLADMHSYGVLSNEDDIYKTQLMAKNSQNTTDYMAIFVPSDIAELIVRARESDSYYSAMVTPNYYCEIGKVFGEKSYIESLDADVMKNLAITYFHSIESNFSDKLKLFFLKHELGNAVAVRDVVNSLYIVWCCELPTVS